MDTAIGTFQADKKAAFTPKRGKIKHIDIFSLERREIDEKTVTDLVEDLARHGSFLHPIAVRDEGDNRYRLISGQQRLEAWKRHFGERQPIDAVIYPSHMPDARVTLLNEGENLHRKNLTAAERRAGLLRYAAARRELEHGKPVTPVSESGQGPKSGTASPSLPPARGGRGNKGMARKIAEELRIDKRSVNRDLEAASVAIDEPIDLYRDTPEELRRKAAKLERVADKRQHAEPKVEQRKRIRLVIKRPTSPAKPEPAEAGSKIEVARKAFDALDSADKRQLAYYACLQIGLMMAPAVFGLAEEEPELAVDLPEVASATDDAAMAPPEQGDEAAVVHAEQGEDSADLDAEDLQVADDDALGDADYAAAEDTADDVSEAADQENLGAEDLEDAGDAVPEAADQEPAGANLHAEHLQDAGVGGSDAADQEPGGAPKCAYCTMEFYSSDERVMIYGRPYHADLCAKFAKPPIAIAA